MIIQIAMDDSAGWNEGDHPRDGTGKFTKGGAVTASLAKSGWKKIGKDTPKTATYTSANGLDTLNVYKDSGKFAGWVGGSYTEGEGKASLPSHLQAGGDGTGGNKSLGDVTHLGGTFTQSQQDYIVNSHVGKLILAAGFKKTKSAAGVLEYKHPSGAKVVVHPPAPDKKSSSDWTHFAPAALEGSKGSGIAIGKMLGQAVAKAEAKKPAPNVSGHFAAMKDTALGNGYMYDQQNGSVITYSSGKDNISVNTETGAWHSTDGPAGVGPFSMANHITNVTGQAAVIPSPAATSAKVPAFVSPEVAETMKKYTYSGAVDLKSALTKEHGYAPPHALGGGVFNFAKEGGGTVEVKSTGEWLAKTPGHMTKEGEGASSLLQLLSGKPAIIEGKKGKLPWANSSKTTLAPPTPAQAAEQAKAQEAQEHQEKLTKAESATQSLLSKAAPDPTPSEKSAVSKYTGSAYMSWNDKLRHDPDFHDDATKNVDSYLEKSSFPEDVTLYRKVSGDYAKILKSILIEGTKFVDHGYVSTSTHKNTWGGSMQWIVSIKKGQKGSSVKKLSHYSSENEVLLPRSSAFVVKSFDRKTGVVHVELDQSHLEKKAAK